MCDKSICTIAHILSGCKVSLKRRRYDFRHNSILIAIISYIKPLLSSKAIPKPSVGSLKSSFVPAGKPLPSSFNSSAVPNGILDLASDWRLFSDLNSDVFPVFITTTTLHLDILIISKSLKTVVILELTSPCEENLSERHNDKVLKYTSLCTAARQNHWVVNFFAVEVSARGYCADSMRSAFVKLGLSRKSIKVALKELSSISFRCSFVIWMSRNTRVWEECDFGLAPNKSFIPKPSSTVSSSTSSASGFSHPKKPSPSQHQKRMPQGLLNK